MSKIYALVPLMVAVVLTGCGTDAVPRDTTVVDVKATATLNGKPLSKTLVIVLQPTGDTNGAKLVATTDGSFTGKAAPGKYIFFVKMAKGDTPPPGIGVKFTEPNAENTVEVATTGGQLDIKVTN